MCKGCQLCLESLYWNCCEERFCYDKSIANFADYGPSSAWDEKCYTNGYDNGNIIENMGYPPVTAQPEGRGVLVELPILAPNIYEVFAKSMIFIDDSIVENEENNKDHKNSNGYYNGPTGKAVSFEDNNNTKNNDLNKENDEEKVPDFYIMFQDEIFPEHKMGKIEEEEEDDSSGPKTPTSPEDIGISMKCLDKIEPTKTPDFVPSLGDPKVLLKTESLKSILKENTAKSLPRARSALYLPRTDSSKSITATSPKQDINRVDSMKNFEHVHQISRPDLRRVDSLKNFDRVQQISRPDLKRVDSMKHFDQHRQISIQDLKRVDSMKNLEENIRNRVLARLPQRSASYLSIPHYNNTLEQSSKSMSQDIFAISSAHLDTHPGGDFSLLSQCTDTPVIKGGKLPKFYAETPEIGVYKAETSLQSIVTTPDVIFTENDYSMPRYYSKNIPAIAQIQPGVHSSRSMPDLRLPVSKRLARLKTKLAPLVIKRHGSGEGPSHHHHH